MLQYEATIAGVTMRVECSYGGMMKLMKCAESLGVETFTTKTIETEEVK